MNIRTDIEIEFSQSEVIDAVLTSGALGVSKHQISLFKYLLKSKYNNELSRVKAYSIAVDIFGRPADFDSSVDSIVRVEMFRLRANLKAFNQDSKKFHLILPKASYEIQIKPLVTNQDDNTSVEIKNTSINLYQKWLGNWKLPLSGGAIVGVTIAAYFIGQGRGDWRKATDCSNLVPNVAIVNNSEKTDLVNYIGEVLKGAAAQFSHINIVKDIESCRYTDVPGYEIQHTLFQGERSFRSTLTVISDVDKQVVGSQNVSGDLDKDNLDFDAVNDDLYYKIVSATNDWLRPHGVIHKKATIASWGDKEKRRDYSCVTMMYDSFVSDSDEAYLESLKCYEESYDRKTPLLDNLGGLAANYLEQAMGIRPHTVDDPLAAAVKLMEEVGDDWPNSVETTTAKIVLEVEREDYNAQRLLSTLYEAEKLYDSNTAILSEVSKYFGFKLGDWEKAKNSSARMKRLITERDNSTFLVDAAYALIHDSSDNMLGTCTKAYSENSRVAIVIVNACALKVGDTSWIQRTESDLDRFKLGKITKRREFIEALNFDETFNKAVMESW